MNNDTWKKLQDQLHTGKQLIILGEVHGASVNTTIIKDLVSRLDIKVILIELETKWQKVFLSLKQRPNDLISAINTEPWIKEAGLVGKEHIILYDEYIRQGKIILPVKVEHPQWNIAERKTAKHILSLLGNYPKDNTLLIIGNFHARKKIFLIKEKGRIKKFIPLGFLLKKKAISIQVRYGKGLAYNFRNITLNDLAVLRKLAKKGKKKLLLKSKSQFFDYDYLVTKTKPINTSAFLAGPRMKYPEKLSSLW